MSIDENHICDGDNEKKLTLRTEEGETECTVIGIFRVEGYDGEYIAMVPDESEEDVYIYKYEEYRNGDFSLYNIESDEEYADVEDVFTELYEDALMEYFDFEEEENGDVEIDDEFIYEDD